MAIVITTIRINSSIMTAATTKNNNHDGIVIMIMITIEIGQNEKD